MQIHEKSTKKNKIFVLQKGRPPNPSQNAGDPKPSPCTAGRSFVKMKEGGGFPQSKLLRYREITTSHDASFSNFFCSVMVTDFQKYEIDFRAWDMRVQTADKKVRSLELNTHPVKSFSGKHVSSSGNRVSFSGKHVSFTGNRASFTGAAGGRDLGASADADAESKLCQSHFCPATIFRSRTARGENANQARRRRNEKNEKSECRKRKPQ